MWLAGGSVKRGQVMGATDAVGLRAARGRTDVHDIHTTIPHLLGFDHECLTFGHDGREQQRTDVPGNIISKALA